MRTPELISPQLLIVPLQCPLLHLQLLSSCLLRHSCGAPPLLVLSQHLLLCQAAR